MALMPMYPGQPNSPQTELAENIDETQTTIPLLDASVLPPGPNLAVIGGGEHAETVLYESIDGDNLINCTRGFQGVASSWQAGQKVARNFTAYDYDALRQNLKSHGSEHNHDGADPIPDLVQLRDDYDAFRQNLTAHLDENVHIGKNASAAIRNVNNQSIPNAQLTPIVFDRAIFDAKGMFDPSEPTRLYCVEKGIYQISASIQFVNNDIGYRQISLRVSRSGTANYIAINRQNALTATAHALSVSTAIDLDIGDYVELIVYQNSGNALDIQASSWYSPELRAVKVG